MSLSVSATSTALPVPTDAAPLKPAARPVAAPLVTASPVAASSVQQTVALNQMLAEYTSDLSLDVNAGTLRALGQQITAAGEAAGQNVILPQASGGSVAPAQVATPAQDTGNLSIMA